MKPTEISFLPAEPGCYLFKDKEGTIIYVGKAKNLKKRVSNYFQKKDHDPKTAALVANIETIDIITTKTEAEAFLLESNLIKKNYPKYNIDLKDSRKYAYILIHEGDLPWIEVARDRLEKGDYYGPFVSGQVRKLIFDVITRNFKIFYKKPSPRYKKIVDPIAYLERVRQAKKILSGKVDELILELEEKMKECSSKEYYEYALTLRNQISALKTLKEKQLIEMTRSVDAHIINYAILGNEVYLLVFSIRKGVLEDKQEYNFPYLPDFFEEFLTQYYDSAPIPQELIIPEEIDPSFIDYLSEKSKRKVSVIVPQKGDKKELLELVSHNINTTFFAGSQRAIELQKILNLEKIPRNIECFDISHLGGTNTVASMVSFYDGQPNKSNYRKFKIHAIANSDDYLAMKEVVKRRYSGSLKQKMKNPDLIVIDGGPGQLSSASSALKELGLNIPIISLAKQFEEIYTQENNSPIIIDKKNKGLQLLQAIRDEAHRFAITYQRSLRSKEIHK